MDLLALIENCAPNVAPSTLQSVIRVESAQLPHAIGFKITRGKETYKLSKQPANVEEAKTWAQYLLENGYKFDAGIAQINSANFARLGLSPANVFDSCANISASGRILSEFYKNAAAQYGPGQKALLAAISAYNSGNFQTGFANGYVQKVVNASAGQTTAVSTKPVLTQISTSIPAVPTTGKPPARIPKPIASVASPAVYAADIEVKTFR